MTASTHVLAQIEATGGPSDEILYFLASTSQIKSVMRFLQVIFSLALWLSLSISAAAQNCEELLLELRPYLTSIEPVLGTHSDFLSNQPPASLLAYIQKEGGELHFLGQGSYGKVYRWENDKAQISMVIKHYDSAISAKSDDLSFQILRRVSHKDDYIQIINEIREPTDRLRFYQDLRGITLNDLENSHTIPQNIREKVSSAFSDYESDLVRRLKAINPEGTVIDDGKAIMVQFPNGPLIAIGLHKKNILFDLESSRLWIIDPF